MVREMIKVNGWSSVFVILILLVSLSECDILTKQENENRLSVCGTNHSAKVWQGRTAAQTEAPWSVFMLRFDGLSNELCTGTIISSRHVLMVTHCFAEASSNGYLDDPMFNKKKNCRDGHYVIKSRRFLERIRFESDGVKIARSPERVILVNACLPKRQDVTRSMAFEDFAIVDLYEDLVFSPTVQMACVAHDVSANEEGVEMDYFGYGVDPAKLNQETSGVLRHEKTKVFWESEQWFKAKDPHSQNIGCDGDSGGGAVGLINGGTTVIGVLSQTSCKWPSKRKGKEAQELYASVGYYYPVICKYTGICSPFHYDTHHNGYVRAPKPVRTTPPPSPQIDFFQERPGQNGNRVHFYRVVTLVISLVLSSIV